MKKTIEYKGYNFTIKAVLDKIHEKGTDGKRQHQITCKCDNDKSFSITNMVDDTEVEPYLESLNREIEKFVDKDIDDKTKKDDKFKSLGFK